MFNYTAGVGGVQSRRHIEVLSRRQFLGGDLVGSYHSSHVGQGPKHLTFFPSFFFSPSMPPSFLF